MPDSVPNGFLFKAKEPEVTHILAIDTSTAWCSVALSLGDDLPLFRHERVSAGASQFLLPCVEELLAQASICLQDLNGIAIGVGPGAFTGVRLGVATVQGLAIAGHIPVMPVISLDAVAIQLMHTDPFKSAHPSYFVVAIDARMDEIYWAKYQVLGNLPLRIGEIKLSKPESLELNDIQFLAGSALKEYGKRLFSKNGLVFPESQLDPEIGLSALGILECAKAQLANGSQIEVHELEPVYIRNKVALTTLERLRNLKLGSTNND